MQEVFAQGKDKKRKKSTAVPRSSSTQLWWGTNSNWIYWVNLLPRSAIGQVFRAKGEGAQSRFFLFPWKRKRLNSTKWSRGGESHLELVTVFKQHYRSHVWFQLSIWVVMEIQSGSESYWKQHVPAGKHWTRWNNLGCSCSLLWLRVQ